MAENRILDLRQSAEGKWEYVSDPDEDTFRESYYFLSGVELALRLQSKDPDKSVRQQDISTETILEILPEWLKDTIYAISVLCELLITRFMIDGKWVKFSKWRIGWNFMSLIMIYRASKDIVKAFKKPGE